MPPTRRGPRPRLLLFACAILLLFIIVRSSPPSLQNGQHASVSAAAQTQIAALFSEVHTLQQQLAALGGKQNPPQTPQGRASSAPPVPAFSCSIHRTIFKGAKGNDVLCLQRFLISQNLLSAGNDSGYFGTFTERAVQTFQKQHSIVSSGTPSTTGYGAVGLKTRTALAKRTAPTLQTPTPVVPINVPIVYGGGGGGSASCSFNGQTLSSGSSVTAYRSSLVPAGGTCSSEIRTCSNGTLSGSFTYSSCVVANSPSATFDRPNPTISFGNGITLSGTASNVSSIRIEVAKGSDPNFADTDAVFDSVSTPVTNGKWSIWVPASALTVAGPYAVVVGGTKGSGIGVLQLTTLAVNPASTGPSCALTVSPSIVAIGNSATLSWTSQNATTRDIEPVVGTSTNNVASGSATVTVGATTNFTMTVSGTNGSVTCSTTLSITKPSSYPAMVLPPHLMLMDLDPRAIPAELNDVLNVPSKTFFSDPSLMRSEFDIAMADIKRLGLDTIIEYSEYYPGLTFFDDVQYWQPTIPYTRFGTTYGNKGFIELLSDSAAEKGIKLILAAPPAPGMNFREYDYPQRGEATECTDTSWNEQFVDYIASFPNTVGYYCSFENYGDFERALKVGRMTQAEYDSMIASIRSMKRYVESRGLYFIATPAANRYAPQDFPADLYTAALEQVSPFHEYDAQTMQTYMQHNTVLPAGVADSIWHSALTGQVGDTVSPVAARHGQQAGEMPTPTTLVDYMSMQYNALVAAQPKAWDTGGWDHAAFPRYGTSQYFYGNRSYEMSLVQRIVNHSLVLYDPLEDKWGTDIIGGTPDDSVVYTPGAGCDTNDARFGGGFASFTSTSKISYTNQVDNRPLLSDAAGSIQLWVRPHWGDSAIHELAVSDCKTAYNCFYMQRSPRNTLQFGINDTTGKGYLIDKDISSWQPNQWHFVAGTWDQNAKRLILYIDGVEVAQNNLTSAWNSSPLSSAVYLGNDASGLYPADADIDDFQLWDSVNTSANILYFYQHFLQNGLTNGNPPANCPAYNPSNQSAAAEGSGIDNSFAVMLVAVVGAVTLWWVVLRKRSI